MAWPPLCTYLRGAPEKMEPLYSYKNAPRHRRVHSLMQEYWVAFPASLAINRTIPKEVSQASLVSAK